MALSKVASANLDGIDGSPVTVEVDVATGLPGFVIVGLADKAVEESRERVRSAIKHSGYKFPLARITVHLSPSEKKKSGVHFDLAIALGILMADSQLPDGTVNAQTFCLGGLSLDGSLQPITGTLSLVDWAKRNGFTRVILPVGNYFEAKLIEGIELLPAESLTQVISIFAGEIVSLPTIKNSKNADDAANDWLQIQGQAAAKRAALIAAAGGHNLLMEGPPGAGKTLLARGLRALLPPLNQDELIEVVKLHSLAGQIQPHQAIDGLHRPFRSPHHTASHIAVIGGGSTPRPGEISLADRGVLFLDELPEFQRPVLEALRQPLEDRVVTISRIQQAQQFPAAFLLVATMNPCPCGWLGSDQKECVCTPFQVNAYRKRISGPILDRIDLVIKVPAVSLKELQSTPNPASDLAQMRQTIARVRERSYQRNGAQTLNSQLKAVNLEKVSERDAAADQLIEQANQRLAISGRGYHRLLKVARTIADINEKAVIGAPEIAEAIRYRFAEN